MTDEKYSLFWFCPTLLREFYTTIFQESYVWYLIIIYIYMYSTKSHEKILDIYLSAWFRLCMSPWFLTFKVKWERERLKFIYLYLCKMLVENFFFLLYWVSDIIQLNEVDLWKICIWILWQYYIYQPIVTDQCCYINYSSARIILIYIMIWLQF